MTAPRSDSMNPAEIETHHVWSRVVQRATLCGYDPHTGTDYSYRRECLQKLIHYQTAVFAVDLGNYTILINHFHTLPRSRPDLVRRWSDEEVAWRYRLAWPSWVDNQWVAEPTDESIETLLADPKKLARAREYLGSISGYMARIKEPVAKLFNEESETKGHFWEARFGNRKLTSYKEIVGCMLYVDLNLIRAGAAESLMESDRSAIQERLRAEQARARWIEQNKTKSLEQIRQDLQHGSADLDPAVLDQLFGDCWLAPISPDGPLSTEEDRPSLWLPDSVAREEEPADTEPTEAERGTAKSRSCENTGDVDNTGERSGEQATNESRPQALCDEALPGNSESAPGKATGRRPGRPKKVRSWRIHRRHRAKLKVRKSNRTFVEADWRAYKKTVGALAAKILSHDRPPPRLPDWWQTTASSWWKETRRFIASISDALETLVAGQVAAGEPADQPVNVASLPPPAT